MTTRRNILKGGAGIAAILAAGKAPAALVRSMLAARNGIAAAKGGGGGWVNPYITDGLIAMWDGEWNAGGGVHNPNATIWKDLIGNMDCRQYQDIPTPSFSRNSIILDGTAKSFTFDCSDSAELVNTNGDGITIEIAADGEIIEEDFGIFTIFPPGPWEFQNSIVIRGAFGGAITTANKWSQHALLYEDEQVGRNLCISCFFPSYEDDEFRLYYMGGFAASDYGEQNYGDEEEPLEYGMIGYGGTEDYPEGFVGNIYNIRIYNRALSDNEILANNNIDRARFNPT